MKRPTPRVSIIIVHFDNRSILSECLQSCKKITYPNYEIIIVNNGSKSLLTVSELQSSTVGIATLINTYENMGYSKANNMGIEKALSHHADYVLLLNDDTVVSPNFLEILLEEGEKSPGTGILGPKVYYLSDPKRISFAGAYFDSQTCRVFTPGADRIDDGDSSIPSDSDYISGCALLIKKEAIEKIGRLDERFFLYWEDVDWGLRSKKAGLRNMIVPSAHIWHRVSVSTGGIDSPLRIYHKTRSRLLLAKLHAPWTLNFLHRNFFRDIAWLILKSHDKNRIRKALAYLCAINDYHTGKTNKGPGWLWRNL